MKFHKFDNDDDDYDDDPEFDEDEMDPEMMAEMYRENQELREADLRLSEKHLRVELLAKAIAVAEKSWTWFLLPEAMKLRKVGEIYRGLKNLTD